MRNGRVVSRFKAEHFEEANELGEEIRDCADAMIDAIAEFGFADDYDTAADRREARDEAVLQFWSAVNEYEEKAAELAAWIAKFKDHE